MGLAEEDGSASHALSFEVVTAMRMLFGVLLGVLIGSCGSDPPVKPVLSDIQRRIFNVSCTFSSCHSVDGHKGELVLVDGQSRDNIVSKDAHNTEAERLMKIRVVPGQPDTSYLFQKINRMGANFCTEEQLFDEDPSCEGEAMPSTNERLPQQRIDAVRAWILAGAKND